MYDDFLSAQLMTSAHGIEKNANVGRAVMGLLRRLVGRGGAKAAVQSAARPAAARAAAGSAAFRMPAGRGNTIGPGPAYDLYAQRRTPGIVVGGGAPRVTVANAPGGRRTVVNTRVGGPGATSGPETPAEFRARMRARYGDLSPSPAPSRRPPVRRASDTPPPFRMPSGRGNTIGPGPAYDPYAQRRTPGIIVGGGR